MVLRVDDAVGAHDRLAGLEHDPCIRPGQQFEPPVVDALELSVFELVTALSDPVCVIYALEPGFAHHLDPFGDQIHVGLEISC